MKKIGVVVLMTISLLLAACAELEKNAGKGAENIRKIPDNVWKGK